MAPRNSEESDAHGHAALEADAADPAATAAPPACATASEVVAPGSLKKWFHSQPRVGEREHGKEMAADAAAFQGRRDQQGLEPCR